jgi:hypothetical protein
VKQRIITAAAACLLFVLAELFISHTREFMLGVVVVGAWAVFMVGLCTVLWLTGFYDKESKR